VSFVVALVGAESTGKTTLSLSLAEQLSAEGRRVALVPEYLREFCDRHGRTPRQDEQQPIADEQMRRIAEAAQTHDVVVADTTALMIAVYSDTVFGDTSLYAAASLAHRGACDLTLLTALDLPWRADGLQRDGPQVREPVDARLRAVLRRSGIDHAVVFGHGPARLMAALASVRRALAPPLPMPDDAASPARWQWHCERCGDTACERHALLPRINTRAEHSPR